MISHLSCFKDFLLKVISNTLKTNLRNENFFLNYRRGSSGWWLVLFHSYWHNTGAWGWLRSVTTSLFFYRCCSYKSVKVVKFILLLELQKNREKYTSFISFFLQDFSTYSCKINQRIHLHNNYFFAQVLLYFFLELNK